MTKFSSGLLAALMLLSFTATAQFSLTIGSQSNVQSGQQVCLNVTTQNFTNIIGMQFSINYNPSMLQLTSVSNFSLAGLTAGGNFGLPISGGAGTTAAGTITVSWTDGDLSGETLANGATLFTLCFNALASTGSSQVGFSGMPTAIEITNTALQIVPFNSNPGTVTFGSGGGGGTPTPISLAVGSQSNVMSGTQVCVNVTVQNFTSITAFQTTLTYNSMMLQNVSVSNFGVAGMTAANFNTGTPGTIAVNWTNATAQTVASGGVLFRLCFTANASSGSTQVTVGSSTATNASSQSVTVNSTPGTVSFAGGGGGGNPTGFTLTIGSQSNVQSGTQVCLDVTTANFNNIVGMQFSISYNPAMLQLTSVSNFGLPGLNAGGSFGLPIAGGAGLTSAGTITMTWTDPDQSGETLANGSTLFTLCFNALASTGSTQVTFSSTPTSIEIINTALQNVPFNNVPGTVTFGGGGGGGTPTPIALSVGSQSNVISGTQVCLDVTVQNFTSITAFQTTLTYNSMMLQNVSVSNFGVAGMTAANFNTGTPGTIAVNWTNATAQTVASGGVLFRLCFTANASSGSTQVTVGSSTATNASSQSVTVNSTPGTVSFNTPTGFTLTIGSQSNVQSGTQVCLDVTAANFNNIVGMQFSISYNPAMLQLTSVSNFGLPGLNAGGSFGLPIAGGAGLTSAGTITMTWTDPDQSGETLANGSTLFTLCFNALASTGSTQVTFSSTPTSIEIINTALQNVPFNNVPGTVTFGGGGGGGTPTPIALSVGSQSNVISGTQVCLDVTVQNFTSITAFQTTLTYNSMMLQNVSVSNFGVAGMTAANFNTGTPGTIAVNWTNATAQTVASGGVLFRLCFTANASSGSTQVTVGSSTATNASSQSVTVNSTPGTVSFNTPTGFTLIIGSQSNVQSGTQVCLDVTTANFNNIVGMQFSISYNPAMLQLTSVSNFGLPGLNAGGSFGLPIAGGAGLTSAGTITMTWTDPDQSGETLANGSTLFTLCFNALASTGSTQVTFSSTPTSIEIINTALQNVPFNNVPGTVTFGVAPPSPINLTVGSQSNVMSGTQVCLDVTVQNFTNITAFQTTLTYNSMMLQNVSVSNFGVAGMTAANFNTGTPGTIAVNWTNAMAQTVASGGVLFRLCFTANAESGSTQVTAGSSTATNASSQSVTVNSMAGTVSFTNGGSTPMPISLSVGSQSNVINGTQVCLDVTVQNFTNITAFQTTLTYNSMMLQNVSVSNFGVAGMTAANFNTGTPGTIGVNWTNATAQTVASGGVLFRLCFTANANSGSTEVTVGSSTATNAASQSVTVNSTPGTVSFNTPTGFTLIIGSQSNVQSGTQVCLNVTTVNFNNILGMQFSISYNPAMLQLTSVSNFGLPGLNASGSFGLPIAGGAGLTSAGTITMTWTDPDQSGETLANGSTLFTLCFNALASTGSTQVSFSGTPTSIEVTNTALQIVPFNNIPGTVTFGSVPTPPISLAVGSQSDVISGTQVCLDVTVQNFTNITAFQTTLTYNSMMLQNVSVSNFGVAGMTAANFNTGTPGTIAVNWTNATAQTVASGGVLFRLCFTANASSGSTQVTVGSSTATNASSQPVTVNSTPGTVTFTVPITPPVIATPANITNVTCFGASTGAIDISVSGGTGNYTYLWSYQNRTTQDLTGIPAGTYTVTVTDTGSGLTTNGSFTVTQPAIGISIIAIPANVACTGASTGGITLNVSGGTGPYNYDWSGTLPDGVPNQSNLPAGTYAVTVSDANGCTATQSITITEPTGIPLTISSMVQPVVCGGASTGRITLNISGGTPNYTINWCCGLPANAAVVSNLAAGTYNVTVTDNNGCTATRTINVGENPVLQLTSITPTHINNGNDGAINITVTGGTGGYSFLWTGPAGFAGSTQPGLGNLNIPGQYCVTVTDNSGCTVNGCVQLQERLRFGSVQIGRSCTGASTGSIQLNVLGGVPPYNYTWNPGGAAGPNRNNLAAGTYNVTVTDQAGGILAGSFVVENFPAAVVSGTVVNASGNITDANGSVILNISGGTPGYNILWAPGGATGLVLSNVLTGQYCATVTDMAGCSVVQCFTVGFNPGSLVVLNSETTPITCPGDQNGTLSIRLDGGLPPFNFVFSDGFTQTVNGVTLNRSNLPGGTLTYTVSDAQGTVINGSATIGASSVVTATNIAVVHDSEEPGCTGSVTLTLAGGTTPYQLQWNTPNTGGPAINNLCAGTFIPTVTDGNGCVFVLPGIEVNTFGLSATSTATNCPGDATGLINLTVSGGSAPYSFEWRNAAGVVVSNAEDLANALPGTYTVRVTESSGNVLVRIYTVSSQSALAIDVDVTSNYNGFDVRCHNTADGVMQATAFNGQGNYTFEWRRNGTIVGGSGATLSNAAPGNYEVRVTDGLGCTATETLALEAPQPVSVVANTISPSCVGGNDGQIFAVASGGVFALPYNYEWNNGAFGPRLTFLRAGAYTVTVNDVNNCTTTATFTVSNPAPINVTVNSTPATDGCNGSVLAVVAGGNGPFTFTWSTGQVTSDPFLTGLCPGEYFVMVTDSRGCRPNPNLVSGIVRDRRTPCLDIRVVITPDGDGLNEEFIISCVEEFANNHLEIYNRWGQLVYEADNYDNTWKGTTRNGSELPDGPYYFVFEYTDIDGIRQQLKGSITLLRR